MFKNSYQSGHLSILYSLGSKPLQIWDQTVKEGHVRRVADEDIQGVALELAAASIANVHISCPADPTKSLGIKLPHLTLVVKNLDKFFSFEVALLDDMNIRRRFRASNYQGVTRVQPFICTMPLRLDDGWNVVCLNLTDLTKRAYGTNFAEASRVQVHANCRLRRVYFSDKAYSEEDLPPEFRLYVPLAPK